MGIAVQWTFSDSHRRMNRNSPPITTANRENSENTALIRLILGWGEDVDLAALETAAEDVAVRVEGMELVRARLAHDAGLAVGGDTDAVREGEAGVEPEGGALRVLEIDGSRLHVVGRRSPDGVREVEVAEQYCYCEYHQKNEANPAHRKSSECLSLRA